MRIYKVCSAKHWAIAKAKGIFTGVEVDVADGYIHFSTGEQLAETLKKHFAGQSDLVLLTIETEQVDTEFTWEPSRGGALFPHLYADLPLAGVVGEHVLKANQQGVFILPEGLTP